LNLPTGRFKQSIDLQSRYFLRRGHGKLMTQRLAAKKQVSRARHTIHKRN
jgi:hypothetical protein